MLRILRHLRIIVTVLSLTACVLLIGMSLVAVALGMPMI